MSPRLRPRAPALCVAWGCLLALAALGCEDSVPKPDFERMIRQRGYRPFEDSGQFPDGRVMQPPPEGTVPRGELLGPRPLTAGLTAAGAYTADIPVPVTRALLERGHDRFDIYCAVCHGVRGDGISMVATNMTLRRPPSLIAAPVTSFPPGRIFQVVSLGYGLMPAYDVHLAIADRWAVVAYLRALQRSQSVRLADLRPDERARAQTALRAPETGR